MNEIERIARKLCADAGVHPDSILHTVPLKIYTPNGIYYQTRSGFPAWAAWTSIVASVLGDSAKQQPGGYCPQDDVTGAP